MLLNLTDLSDEPLQSQISRQIRAKILAGELAAGEMLPSIRGLARDVHVSVITVQRGYEHLEREGLIHSRRGKGFFVSEIKEGRKREMAKQKLISDLRPLLAEAFAEGMTGGEIMAAFKALLNELSAKRNQQGGEKS
jgi:GntR family transcriptional regulator